MSVTRPATMRELLAATAHLPGDAVLRYYQTSSVAPDGSVHPDDCLALSMEGLRGATLSEEDREVVLDWIRGGRHERLTEVLKRLLGGG